MPHYLSITGALAVLPTGEVMLAGGQIAGVVLGQSQNPGISAVQLFKE